MAWLSYLEVEGDGAGAGGEIAAKPVTAVWDEVSTSVGVTEL